MLVFIGKTLKRNEEVPKCIFEWTLQESMQKEIINHVEVNLFFNEIDRGKLGVVELLIEIFQIRCKLYSLQENENARKYYTCFRAKIKVEITKLQQHAKK